MIVLLAHFQIIVDVIEYYASARTFVMNGTELCTSVFVVGITRCAKIMHVKIL